jgi:hypothetical protein
MCLQMKLRQYVHSPNAERCRKCATLRQNWQSEYQQRCWRASGQLAISRMLSAEPQHRP